MKKFVLCSAVFFFILGSVSFAQVSFGVKAGINLATLGGEDSDLFGLSPETKTGLVAGAFMYYGFSDMFGIQPEALYTMKGAKFSGAQGEATLSINYIEVPVLLKLNIPVDGSSMAPFIYAGPAIAFKMSGDVTVKPTGGAESTEELDDIKGVDLSAAFGAGIGFPIGAVNTIGIDIRYSLGLTSIDDSGSDASIKNNVISVMVFYGF